MYGLLAYITLKILLNISISHTVFTLGPTLPLILLGLCGLTQHMDDDWEDMSHVGTGHSALIDHGYGSALVRNAK